MIKPLYQVYVEGGLYQETASLRIALRVASKARAEGWNVAVFKEQRTILGMFRARVD